MYKEAGLLGLFLGGAEKKELAPFFQRYMKPVGGIKPVHT